ncbi:lipoyl(octanoyl) transferase LipB [Anatilimnocola floriformis]|uniref:lipoyl(octanoyl) transferase LipB n=1 Tax=Anatilimnocola floriformis TaxID=2948575 RepID=UPI0020C56754|nr:hypothetical protein [Anatilimnocola floriformis]
MSRRAPALPPFATHFFSLGLVDYEDCLTAQKRLAYDAVTRGDGRMTVLMCEHPNVITIGRRGSRDQLQLTGAELAERELTVRYVARGGGCLLHAPGQLAIYVITQLGWHRWSVGDFLRRWQNGLADALQTLNVQTQTLPKHFGLWGKSGLLAALGVAVKFGVSTHGAFLNVDPDLRSMRRIEAVPAAEYRDLTATQPAAKNSLEFPTRPVPSSLLSETAIPVKMDAVRAAVVAQLAAAFDCGNYQLHTSHPLLPEIAPEFPGTASRESVA